MKKLALILAMLLVIPGAAFGLEMMNDSAMDEVTGQSGVSIAFDDVSLFLNIERIAWVDMDGIGTDLATGTAASGGAVGIENFTIDTIDIQAIVATDGAGNLVSYKDPLNYTGYATNGTNAVSVIADKGVAALSIDVAGGLPVLTAGLRYNVSIGEDTTGAAVTDSIGGVYIGLPTVEISIPSMSLEPKFWAAPNGTVAYTAAPLTISVANSGCSYGRLDLGNITFSVLSGWMEIAPH